MMMPTPKRSPWTLLATLTLIASGAAGCDDAPAPSGDPDAGVLVTLDAGECVSPADCPGTDSECGVRTCTAGTCGMLALRQEGHALASQRYGDCQVAQCDALGNVVGVPDATDTYDDGNPCTLDVCADSEPAHFAQTPGLACGGGGSCSPSGECVRCNLGVVGECPMATPYCVASPNYVDIETPGSFVNRCVPQSCRDGVKGAGETDVDCGGPTCAPCATGATCNSSIDCMEAACDSVLKTCSSPTCFDGSRNGDETFPDFGGSVCPPLLTSLVGYDCRVHADCASGVCRDAMCAAPTCFDATTNGDEEGVDCGGSCAASCLAP